MLTRYFPACLKKATFDSGRPMYSCGSHLSWGFGNLQQWLEVACGLVERHILKGCLKCWETPRVAYVQTTTIEKRLAWGSCGHTGPPYGGSWSGRPAVGAARPRGGRGTRTGAHFDDIGLPRVLTSVSDCPPARWMPPPVGTAVAGRGGRGGGSGGGGSGGGDIGVASGAIEHQLPHTQKRRPDWNTMQPR